MQYYAPKNYTIPMASIPTEDRERIISILKNEIKPNSISDISRRTKINRNKVSQIIQVLQREGMVDERREGRSKLYRIKYDFWHIPVMDAISDHAIILDINLNIVRINKRMAQTLRKPPDYWIGKSLLDIPSLQFNPDFPKKIHDLISCGSDGDTITTQKSGHTSESVTCIKIPIQEDQKAALVLFPTGYQEQISSIQSFYLLPLLEQLSEFLLKIKENSTRNEVYTSVIDIIHAMFPDSVSVIAELSQVSCTAAIFHSIIPESLNMKFQEANFDQSVLNTPVSVDPLQILKIRTEQPHYITHFSDLIWPYKRTENIGVLDQKIGLMGGCLYGIFNETTCTGYLGIGYQANNIAPETYRFVARILTDILQIHENFSSVVASGQRANEEYLANYKQFYSQLNDLLHAQSAYRDDARTLRMILFNILDKLGILAIVCTNTGEILELNSTFKKSFNISSGRDIINLTDLIQGEDGELLLRMMEEEDVSIPPGILPGISLSGSGVGSGYQWYHLKQLHHGDKNEHIWVAEYQPAVLIESSRT